MSDKVVASMTSKGMKNNEQVLSVIHFYLRQNVAEQICGLSVCAKVRFFNELIMAKKNCTVVHYTSVVDIFVPI